MKTKQSYEIGEEVYQGHHSIVYNGTCSQDGTPVILKTLRGECLTSERIYNLRNEYEVTKKFENVAGIIQVLGIESLENSLAIVVEDFGAKSLASWLSSLTFSLEQTLQIGVSIASALDEIHRQQIMHKDINPKNIVYNPETHELKIIDFGIASLVSREKPGLEISGLVGTLSYISPEQTGRMNRFVDYRTDFYSFGATLYELLCGHPPFQTDDLLEIVHCHIARQPARVDEVNPNVPEIVADIVEKLLSKNADERYQSARGIKVDLENCLRQLRKADKIERFPLGKQDFSGRLIIGQKLYGRTVEIDQLLLGFELILAGQNSLFLISGRSGIGKSVLVNEVHKPITERQGFFLSAKFDQFDRNTPYIAIVEAFNKLARQLLSQNEDRIRQWKKLLLEALQENAGIITEMFPDWGMILGPQPTVDPLPPEENKNRFNVVFQKFIEKLATPEHPIVLFLDDLQWADIASLELLKQILVSHKGVLYIIGAYRSNEVSRSHALAHLIEEMKGKEIPVIEVALSPLSESDVNQLISDTLSLPGEEVQYLARLVFEKTNGNPFFINQLLESFYSEGLLYFGTEDFKWQWKLEDIEQYGFTDNVVDLLVTNLEKLSLSCQRILQQAACVGTEFDNEMLVSLRDGDAEEIERALEEAISSGLILKKSASAVSLRSKQASFTDGPCFQYRFAHDRILQAVYTTISPKDRLSIHYRVGQSFLEKYELDSNDQHLFQIVAHLNLSRSLIETHEARKQLLLLNLQAGKRAKQAAANEAALEYLEVGSSLLEPESWQNDYETTLSLYEELAEAAHLTADGEKVTSYTTNVFENTKSIEHQIKTIEVKIRSLFAADKNVEGLRFGLECLHQLGLKIPRHPTKIALITALLRAKLSLLGKTDEEILNLPPMTDERILTAMRVLSAMSYPAFTADKKLYAYLIMTQVRLIARFGHSVYSSSTYCSYGVILCGVLRDIKNGYRMGNLAIRLLDKYFDRSRICRVHTLANGFIFPWKQHISNSSEGLQQAYRQGVNSGDFQYASTAMAFYLSHRFFEGAELNKLLNEMVTGLLAVTEMKQIFMQDFILVHKLVCVNFAQPVPDPCSIEGDDRPEEVFIERARRDGNDPGEWIVYGMKVILCCFYSAFDRGREWADKAYQFQQSGSGTTGTLWTLPCMGIIYLRATKDWQSTEGKRSLRLVKEIEKEIKRQASDTPTNCLHLLKLLQAEKNRAFGDFLRAAELYDEAIELAAQNRFINWEALGNELAADLYLARGKKTIARSYAENARVAYLTWGAQGKVDHIENKFNQLLPKIGIALSGTDTNTKASTRSKTGSVHSSTRGVDSFDFRSVFKAAQGISREIVLEKLLGTLVQTVIENAGAEKGFLIIDEAGKLRVEAGYSYEGQNISSFDAKPLAESGDLSSAIVRLVYRSKEAIVLGDASAQENLRHDPYIQNHQPKSVLCMPIIHGGKLTAILYLENNKTADVFTNDRIDAIEILSSQAAISIQNAKLYCDLVASKELLQEALLQAQESERVKTRFLARTGHELRTPLNPLINIPEWIIEGFSESPGAECISCGVEFEMGPDENLDEILSCPLCGAEHSLQKKQVDVYNRKISSIKEKMLTVVASATKLNNLVNDILSFNELQSGTATLALNIMSIESLLENIRGELRTFADANSVTIEIANGCRDSSARLDGPKVHQVLLILGKNAIQFSPPKGTIYISSEYITNGLLFSVRDEGIGIDKSKRNVIFESFRQVEEGHLRKHGGAGLGLALAKTIVELHGGQIWVESELDKGSTFYVQLPQYGDQQG